MLVLESPPSLLSRGKPDEARTNLSISLTHRFPTSLARCYATMGMIQPLAKASLRGGDDGTVEREEVNTAGGRHTHTHARTRTSRHAHTHRFIPYTMYL